MNAQKIIHCVYSSCLLTCIQGSFLFNTHYLTLIMLSRTTEECSATNTDSPLHKVGKEGSEQAHERYIRQALVKYIWTGA